MSCPEPTTCIVAGVGLAALAIWPFRRSAGERDSADTTHSTDEPDAAHSGEQDEHIDRGIKLGMLGYFARAADSFRLAVEIDPDDAVAHYNLALTLDLLGQDSKAEQHYEAAARLKPDFAGAHNNHGMLLFERGDIQGAADRFRAAIAADPGEPTAYFNLGCCYLREQEFRLAAEAFRDSAAADPKDAMTRFNLAIALRKAGCANLAEGEMRAFLELAGGRYPEHRAYVESLLEGERGG